ITAHHGGDGGALARVQRSMSQPLTSHATRSAGGGDDGREALIAGREPLPLLEVRRKARESAGVRRGHRKLPKIVLREFQEPSLLATSRSELRRWPARRGLLSFHRGCLTLAHARFTPFA